MNVDPNRLGSACAVEGRGLDVGGSCFGVQTLGFRLPGSDFGVHASGRQARDANTLFRKVEGGRRVGTQLTGRVRRGECDGGMGVDELADAGTELGPQLLWRHLVQVDELRLVVHRPHNREAVAVGEQRLDRRPDLVLRGGRRAGARHRLQRGLQVALRRDGVAVLFQAQVEVAQEPQERGAEVTQALVACAGRMRGGRHDARGQSGGGHDAGGRSGGGHDAKNKSKGRRALGMRGPARAGDSCLTAAMGKRTAPPRVQEAAVGYRRALPRVQQAAVGYRRAPPR
eukprot:64483-Chlamydomonas_euryale.AAC.6